MLFKISHTSHLLQNLTLLSRFYYTHILTLKTYLLEAFIIKSIIRDAEK